MEATERGKVIKTRAWQVATSALDRIAREQILGVIIAPPGIGKTHAIQQWRLKRGREVRHIAIEATLRQSSGPILYCLARALGLPVIQRLDRIAIAIAESLAKDPRLVIIDEADMLKLSAFEMLRGIWDLVSEMRELDGDRAFPLALFGTERLKELLGRPDLERLHRRVGELDELERMSKEEVEVALKAKWPAVRIGEGALEELWMQSKEGSFGWLNRIVPIASALAAKDGQIVTPEIVRGSLRYLLGRRGR